MEFLEALMSIEKEFAIFKHGILRYLFDKNRTMKHRWNKILVFV